VGHFRAFTQPIIAYAVGVAPSASPIDQTRVDMLQAFGEADLGPVTVRAGRQMLSLGTERLVGTRYGPNVPLAFDGVRAIVRLGKAKVNLFAVKPVTPGPGSFDDKTSSTRALWGAYGSIPGSTSIISAFAIAPRISAGYPGVRSATRSARAIMAHHAAGTGMSRQPPSSGISQDSASVPGRWAPKSAAH
jgi:hypothetical protein